jgi:hypothetical protein
MNTISAAGKLEGAEPSGRSMGEPPQTCSKRGNARFQAATRYVSGVVLVGMGMAAGLASASARPL